MLYVTILGDDVMFQDKILKWKSFCVQYVEMNVHVKGEVKKKR